MGFAVIWHFQSNHTMTSKWLLKGFVWVVWGRDLLWKIHLPQKRIRNSSFLLHYELGLLTDTFIF